MNRILAHILPLAILCLPAQALAAFPSATTKAATSVVSTSANLNGTANPGGEASTGWFRLSTSGAGPCNDSYGIRVPGTGGTTLGSGSADTNYQVTSTGLLPNTTYFFCAVVNNGSGTAYGSILSFNTTPVAPTVTTSPATDVTANSVTLNGLVNPNGSVNPKGYFRLGTSNPGSCYSTWGTPYPGTLDLAVAGGHSNQPISQAVTGLSAGTTYYYCAVGTSTTPNSTIYGGVASFTTLTAAPSVTTTAASSVTGTSAQLNGNANPNGATTTGWFRISPSDPGGCSDAFGTRVPAVSGGSSLGSVSSPQSYYQSATGLSPGTTYYFCAIAQNGLGTSTGSVLTFTTPAIPTVTTAAATSLTATSATLNGTENPNLGSATGTTVWAWFRYSTVNPATCNDSFGTRAPSSGTTTITGASAPYSFSQSIGGLLPGTTYYYCALTSNIVGTGWGGVQVFVTPATAPLVSTNSATAISGTGATLNGQADPRGDATIGFFRYSTTNPGASCTDSFGTRAPVGTGGTNLGSGNGYQSFQETLTGLTPGTTYYFCALASNSKGTTLDSSVYSFTTPNAPTVTTTAASSLTGTTAYLNGNANPNLATTTGYFRYSTTNPTTCDDTFGTRLPAVSGGTGLGAGASIAYFDEYLTGLSPGTTYYFCALASNAVGTSVGTVLSFTTPALPTVTTTAIAPPTDVTATSATLRGSATPNLGSASSTVYGWFRYSSTNPTTCNDSFGTRVPSSTGVTLTGTPPIAYSQGISGLLPGTTYYFCALASNLVGTSYGSVLSFTTPATAPFVSTSSADLVTGSSARLNGQANPRGAATTGWFRYATTDPGNCDDTFGTRVPAVSGGTSIPAGNSYVSYTESLTGLSPGTTYYFCAIASNSVGTTTTSSVYSFTTFDVPTVVTQAATSIGGTTAYLNGTGDPNLGSATGYFRYSTTNPVTCNDSFGTRAPAVSGGTALGAGTSAVFFDEYLTGLTPGATYYFCALASNSVGTGFGAVLTFSTPAVPTVTTSAATTVTATSAVLNGSADPNGASTTGWFRYSTANPTTCNDTFGTRLPAVSGGTALGAGSTDVPFDETASLQPGTTYYFCAIAYNLVGYSYGSVLSFTTPALVPLVSTTSATGVTAAAATLNGSTNPRGAATTAWFRYSSTNPTTCDDSFGTRVPTGTGGDALGAGNGAVTHSEPVTGLTIATTYYFCAIAENSVGKSFGSVLSFTTNPTAPTVTTLAATAITSTQATLNATAVPNGATSTGWVRYSTTNPGSCNDTFGTRAPSSGGNSLGAGLSGVDYSITPTTLAPGTTYYYCAIASNSWGTGYGEVLTFKTASIAPTLNTLAATSIGGTTATLNGSANPNGDPTVAWFRYSTTNPTTCNDSFGTRVPTGTGGADLGAGTAATPFNQALTGLSQGTTYYFCALARNAVGTSLGNVLSFTTPAVPTIATKAASPVTTTTATLNGTGTANGSATIGWFRYSDVDPSFCDDTFGLRIPSSSGANLGSASTPTDYSQGLTGLSPGKAYYFCAIAQNAVGTSYGTVFSFTTPATSPSVTTVAAAPVTATTATLNGSAIPNGAASIGYHRYSTTNPGACSDSFGTRAPAAAGTGVTLGSGTTAQAFGTPITGLAAGTTYYFCALASNTYGTGWGSVMNVTTPDAPSTSTSAATSVGTVTATLNGTSDPNRAATTGWFRYSTTSPGATCNDTFGTRAPLSGGTDLGSGATALPFSAALTGLLPATTYYFCAISENVVGKTYGSVRSFSTSSMPTVVTLAPSALGSTTATLAAQANPNGYTSTGWFRYYSYDPVACSDSGGTRSPASSGTALGSGNTLVPFSASITGLSSGWTYYACAIASNASGTAVGAPIAFTTLAAPSVTTAAADGLGPTAATLHGSATPNGAATTGWFRYSTTNPVACNDTFGTRVPSTLGTDLGSGATAVDFQQALTGLTSGTTYYYCAIASNSVGTRFGGVLTVTTQSGPTVTTSAANAISGTGATLNGSANPRGLATTGWFRYATATPTTCNDTFGTRVPATGGTNLGSGSSAASFNEALTGLTPGTTYYYCALASNSIGTTTGSVLSFTTANSPTVTTVAATSLTSTGATLNGSANPRGAAATGYFRWSATNPSACDDVFGTRAPAAGGSNLGSGSSAASFSQALTGLTASTTYYYCAIAQNAVGTSFGAVMSFTTPAAPTVTTNPPSVIGSTTATLSGSANPNGSSATGWFRYSTVNPVTCTDTFGYRTPSTGGTSLGSGSSATPFTSAISGLTSGTTYYVCAIASNAVGTSFGAVVTFSTAGAPTVSTAAATAVGSGGATLNGTGTANGSATTGWFRYSTTNPVTCNDAFGTRAPASGGTDLGAGSTSTPFSQAVTGLTPNATYYFCAIAANTTGTRFGAVLSFTTLNTPTVTTVAATSITPTGATLNGSANPNGSATTAWFRFSATDPGACDDTFGTRAPASAGSSLGSGTSAATFSQALTGLTAGTAYWFCAIASNANGTSFGALLSFIAPAAPVVTTAAATAVSGSGATLNGSANPKGAATTGWFRYATTNPTTCNDTFGTRAPLAGGSTVGSGGTAAAFTQTVGGLVSGTTYYFCAVAENSEGKAYGAVMSFTTLSAPTVTTAAASALTATSVTLNGSANPNGSATTGWFRWSATDPGACNDTFGTRAPSSAGSSLGSGTSAAAYNLGLSALLPGKTYYYCAIAQNGGGTAYGSVVSFATLAAAPTVSTSAPTAVKETTATLNGAATPNGAAATGWFRYATVSPGTCNDTFGVRAPSTGGTALGAGNSSATFTQDLTGLTGGTTYYVCAIAQNSVGTGFGTVQTLRTPGLPTATTSSATGIIAATATLNGSGNPNGSDASGWFRISSTNPTTCDDAFGTRVPVSGGNALGTGITDVGFSQSATGLTPGTTYYFCAIVRNALGTAFGQVLTFTVGAVLPMVTTGDATDVTATSATLNGALNPNLLAGLGWFRYSTANPGICNDTFGTRVPSASGQSIAPGSSPSPFSLNVTGLLPNATYYFCAVGMTSAGAGFGQLKSFKTPTQPPTVTTQEATVEGATAFMSGLANPNGLEATAWFQVSTEAGDSCGASFGQKMPADEIRLGSGQADVPFTEQAVGFEGGKTYYYCAAAKSSAGTRYGKVVSFTMPVTDVSQPGCGCASAGSATTGAMGLAVLLGALARRRRRG